LSTSVISGLAHQLDCAIGLSECGYPCKNFASVVNIVNTMFNSRRKAMRQQD